MTRPSSIQGSLINLTTGHMNCRRVARVPTCIRPPSRKDRRKAPRRQVPLEGPPRRTSQPKRPLTMKEATMHMLLVNAVPSSGDLTRGALTLESGEHGPHSGCPRPLRAKARPVVAG